MNDQAMGWLTVDEAAALIRVPKSWLYERTRTNTVPHVKLGKYLRFDQQEFLTWARQFRRDGRGRGARARHTAPVVQNSRTKRPALG
jgi:excisionase family DNA binding protein